MKRFIIQVKNNEIIGTHFALTDSLKLPDGRKVSNARALTDEQLISFGYYPVEDASSEIDSRYQKIVGTSYTISTDKVLMVHEVHEVPLDMLRKGSEQSVKTRTKLSIDQLYHELSIPEMILELTADTSTLSTEAKVRRNKLQKLLSERETTLNRVRSAKTQKKLLGERTK